MNRFESDHFFIIDGDTIIIHDQETDNLTLRLRLIDCAERQRRGQLSNDSLDIAQWRLGEFALQRAVELLSRRTIEVAIAGTDQYGRSLADVRVAGTRGASQVVQSQLVRAGLALPYFPISPILESGDDVRLYRRLVVDAYQARLGRLGFWSPDYQGELPYEFRKRRAEINQSLGQ